MPIVRLCGSSTGVPEWVGHSVTALLDARWENPPSASRRRRESSGAEKGESVREASRQELEAETAALRKELSQAHLPAEAGTQR